MTAAALAALCRRRLHAAEAERGAGRPDDAAYWALSLALLELAQALRPAPPPDHRPVAWHPPDPPEAREFLPHRRRGG